MEVEARWKWKLGGNGNLMEVEAQWKWKLMAIIIIKFYFTLTCMKTDEYHREFHVEELWCYVTHCFT